jgi:osmoprotectant transport system substrate-binding protein
MIAGDINMYWEYTGTAWLVYQKQTDVNIAPKDLYTKVVAGDKKFKVTWLPMTSFNDTYAFAITKKNAAAWGVKNYSGLVKNSKMPAKPIWCVESEFQSRPDGWAGFRTKYGINDADVTVKVLDTGAIYQATKDGQCDIGEVFATDGRIGALGLTVPTEDKSYFPPYNAALTMPDSIAKKYPQLVKALAPIAGKISNAVMQNLNARIDVLGEDADEVAKSFLVAAKLIK